MRIATEIVPAGRWPRERERDCIMLAYEERRRRRIRLVADGGTEFLLDLRQAAVMREGDGLRLEDGDYIRVCSAPEELIEATATSAEALVRLAWHLGNRHLAAEIGRGCLRLRRDHVIEEMLRRLGATLRPVEAPFDPVSGAYSGANTHDHEHDHRHGEGNSHDHDDAPGRSHRRGGDG
jgi:urease accessory protein